jgi:CheY-like chemotaxis protein
MTEKMVLIVEDENGTAASLERMIRYSGREAVAVPTASEALALMPIRKPDAIVLDVHLPDVNGLTLLRAIRADPDYKSIPIVIFTGDISASVEREARAAGANDFIVKGTVGTSALLKRLEQYF